MIRVLHVVGGLARGGTAIVVHSMNMRELFIEVVYRHSPVEMILWGVVVVGIWTLLALICKKKEKCWKTWIWINRVELIAITLIIIKYTLLRENHKRGVSLIPFYSFTFPNFSGRYNTVVANVLLFAPLGMSMTYVISSINTESWIRRHPVSVTIGVAAFFSFLVEAFQYIFSLGLCETDDVIFNTLGAAMGTLSFVVFTYLRKKQ